MKPFILTGLRTAVTAILAIAVGAFLSGTGNKQKMPMKQIAFDLSRPEEMKSHVKTWLPLVPGDSGTLVGSVENEPLTIILRHNGHACSFESALITVDIDTTVNGRVDEVFIGSSPMTLHQAISSMERILKMLDTKSDKLNKWATGAVARSNDPEAWPNDTPLPAAARYSENIKTANTWYSVEIPTSADNAKPWRITFRTGPRKFNISPADQPANDIPGPKTE